jgi:hypothetical protein
MAADNIIDAAPAPRDPSTPLIGGQREQYGYQTAWTPLDVGLVWK